MTAKIGNLLKDLQRPNRQNCTMIPYRIRMINDQNNTDFTYFDISEIKSDAKRQQNKPENASLGGPTTISNNNNGGNFNNSNTVNNNMSGMSRKMELLDSCFDIRYAKNYLIFVTNSQEIKMDLIRDEEFNHKEFFLTLGIIMNEKTEAAEMQKVVTRVKRENFMKYFKNSKDWLEIFVCPLEKITTFLRFIFYQFIYFHLFCDNFLKYC